MRLIVPDKYNRNAADVHSGGFTPADTGECLIAYMCERLGLPDLAGLDVLDFGCGSRFADAIVNRRIPLRSYVGIDVYQEMIDFLREHVPDPRLSFHHVNARNPGYNPAGIPLTAETRLPIGNRTFDVICMFSVITHQLPEDARAILAMLRRHVRPVGHLFFSASLEDGDFGYRESVPDAPTALGIYSPRLLRSLLEETGWAIVSMEPPNHRDMPILDSILCRPA